MFDFLKSPKSRLTGKRRREDDILERTNDASQRLRNSRIRAVQRDMADDPVQQDVPAPVAKKGGTNFNLPRR